MKRLQIKFYYKNSTADIIGSENGITNEQLNKLLNELKNKVKLISSEPELKVREDAYRKLPYETKTVDSVKKLADRLRNDCDILVVLGIGGSALGNIALQNALNPYMYNMDDSQRRGPQLFVFDNIDPAQFSSFLGYIDDRLDRTIFNVISKSGRTAETASQFLIIHKMLIDKLGKGALKKHIVATTNPEKGMLRKIARDAGLQTLEIPEPLVGRFSVLSPVGLLSAAVCGIDIDLLLAGARDMDKKVSSEDFTNNPAAVNAAINYYFYTQGKRISVMMPYSSALYSLANWYRQLWAESLGKAYTLDGSEVHIGPTPIKALGSTDQHSQIQLYREGPNDKLFTFLQVDNFGNTVEIGPAPENAGELGFLAGKELGALLNCEKKATEYALLKDNRPCLSVIFPEVNAYTVGQFIYLYEVTTSFAGALFGINPYDQPAVELGKEATFALMNKEADYKTEIDYSQFAKQINEKTDIDEKFLL